MHYYCYSLKFGGKKMFAVCLDGSLPAYHLDRGFGAGENNWLLQFEVLCTQLSLNYLRHAHLCGKDVVIYTAMFLNLASVTIVLKNGMSMLFLWFEKVAMVSLLFWGGEEGDDCVSHWFVSKCHMTVAFLSCT